MCNKPYNIKKMIRISALSILLLCLQFHNVLCQFPINMSANYKYAYSGKYVIDIDASIQTANSTNWDSNPARFSVPYPTTLAGTDILVHPILSDFSLLNIFLGISIKVYLYNANGAVMTFYLYTSNAGNIQKVSIAYLILYNNVAFIGNFAPYSYSLAINKNISKSHPYTGNIFLPTVINMTGGVNIYQAIAGMYATPTNSVGTISILANFTVSSQSQMAYSISSLSDDPTYVASLAYVIILYNQGYLNYSTCKVFDGIIQQTNNNYLSYTNQALEMHQFNTLVGLTSLQVDNQTSLQLFVTLDPPHFIKANSSQLYSYLSVSYFIFWCQYCDYRTPYLYTQNNLCYLSCPTSTMAHQSSLQCNPCSNNCAVSSPTTPSSQGFPVYAIILVAIVGVIVIVMILVFIYLKCKEKNQKKQSQRDASLRKIITFKQQIQIIPQSIPIEKPTEPRFYLIPGSDPTIGNTIENNLNQSHIKVQVRQIWKTADQKIKFEEACFCSRERPYLRCACTHNFHLTCMLDWLLKDKQERRCPLCRQHIPHRAELYCNKCRKYYRIIDLDYLNEDRKRIVEMEINCPECPI